MSDETAQRFLQQAHDRGGDMKSALIAMGDRIDDLESFQAECLSLRADNARLRALLEKTGEFARGWKCKTGRDGAPNYYFVGDPSKAAALAAEIEEELK